jgi:penicillin-binding protein 1A
MKNAKTHHNAEQASAVLIDNNSKVIAMVGGVSYKDSQFNRAVNAKRQPGSAFKIFVYLAALEKGYKPSSIMVDSPIDINGWSPRNFNRQHLGETTLEEAFAKSINTVAVKLSENIGRSKVIEMARRLGIKENLQNVPSIALGSEVTPLISLTNAYNVVANGGYYNEPFLITKITDQEGYLLYIHEPTTPKKVLSEAVINNMKLLLEKVALYGTGQKARLESYKVYSKTGTSQDYRDACFIGFSENLTLGVWVGNDNNKPMQKVSGGGLPASIWKAFMENSLKTYSKPALVRIPREDKPKSIFELFNKIFSKEKHNETINSIIDKNLDN